VVVPLYIPEGGAALYVGGGERSEPVQMRYGVGTLLGAESLHGSAECDYRGERDVRLSVAIYLADVREENLEVIASDSTSLWPTQGDVDWFWAQRGRFWRRDGSRSMREDGGREQMGVQDLDGYCKGVDVALCTEDPTGVRLDCPRTCGVYSEDAAYYSNLELRRTSDQEAIRNRNPDTTTTTTSTRAGKMSSVEEVVNNREQADSKDIATKQIEWLRAKGGFFSDKIEYAPFDKNNTEPSSPHAMFVTSPIRKNEQLMLIPTTALLTAGPSQDMCDTANNLVKEYRLKEASDFAPYVKYVFESFSHEHLPAAFSDEGKDLFATVVGRELPPEDFGNNLFWYACGGGDDEDDKDDERLHEIAYSIVVARSWNDVMVPVYDMVNHRNGHWHNIDQETSAHDGEDVSVVALRDIEVGEQLYLSYNECHDYDCEDMAHSYTLPSMVADYGFVEQYPRRFNFETPDDTLVFDLDIDDNEKVQLAWISEPPDLYQMNWLRSHLHRLRNLVDVVAHGVEELPSHEKDLITEYYKALTSALEHALLFANTSQEEQLDECEDAVNDNGGCGDASRKYDNLEEKPDTLDYSASVCHSDNLLEDYSAIFSQEFLLDEVESQYQKIEFSLNTDVESEKTDTCLRLSGWLQTCTSFRPHYHEALVHYPASYLDTVKRVLFLGGGDNMILHEILKYPSLELVVGMELDQQVVRSSFKSLGTQPHFDRDEVQWWFGDGSKSLLMLPQEYYGTFDLVLVDLQTFVVNSLKVTQELSFMDVALLLLKPEGILVQNEDFVTRNNVDFAQYTVDLEFQDVPILCQQSINMGSDNVDFLHRTPKDHGVETIIFKSEVEQDRHFDAWWNYRRNVNRVNKQRNELDMLREKKESLREAQTNSIGVMIILEVEDVTLQLDSSETVKTAIIQAIKNAGLSETSFVPIVTEDNKCDTFFIVMQEGYITLRVWPTHSYCAFDLMLWGSFNKQNIVQANLIAAVNGQSSSSYRIVSGGMLNHGATKERESHVGSRVTFNNTADPVLAIPPRQSSLDEILRVASSLIQTLDPVIAVICAESTSPCKSFDALTVEDVPGRKIVPIFACADQRSTNDLSQNMFACERESLKDLMELAASTGKMNGIVIDSAAPRAMGQIMYKILSNAKVRMELLTEHYVILAPTVDLDTTWRKNLLERFRTDIAKFSPAHAGDIFFNSTSSSFNLGVFSSGNEYFYSHLANVIETSEKETGLIAEVRSVKDGIINYNPDVEPSFVTDSDYDSYSAYEQWKNQQPLGHQTIYQFGVKTPQLPLSPEEIVLANVDVNAMTGSWCQGRVIEQNNDGTYNIIYDGNEQKEAFDRTLIRKLDTNKDSSISHLGVGERVLIRDDESWWNQGSVLEKMTHHTYKVQVYDGEGSIVIVERHNLMAQEETIKNKKLPRISIPMLKMGLQSTFVEMKIEDVVNIYSDIGDGCIITIFWSQGSVVVVWDGGTHVNINFFTNVETREKTKSFHDLFIERVPCLTLLSRDEHPRGIGGVVNFVTELQYHPHWASFVDL